MKMDKIVFGQVCESYDMALFCKDEEDNDLATRQLIENTLTQKYLNKDVLLLYSLGPGKKMVISVNSFFKLSVYWDVCELTNELEEQTKTYVIAGAMGQIDFGDDTYNDIYHFYKLYATNDIQKRLDDFHELEDSIRIMLRLSGLRFMTAEY